MQGEGESVSEKLVDLALSADVNLLDQLMTLLKRRREQISSGITRRRNMLLNEFLDEMIAQREEKLKQLQNELSILRSDKASVQVVAFYRKVTFLLVDEEFGESIVKRMQFVCKRDFVFFPFFPLAPILSLPPKLVLLA